MRFPTLRDVVRFSDCRLTQLQCRPFSICSSTSRATVELSLSLQGKLRALAKIAGKKMQAENKMGKSVEWRGAVQQLSEYVLY